VTRRFAQAVTGSATMPRHRAPARHLPGRWPCARPKAGPGGLPHDRADVPERQSNIVGQARDKIDIPGNERIEET
jgi:hypothetical protein